MGFQNLVSRIVISSAFWANAVQDIIISNMLINLFIFQLLFGEILRYECIEVLAYERLHPTAHSPLHVPSHPEPHALLQLCLHVYAQPEEHFSPHVFIHVFLHVSVQPREHSLIQLDLHIASQFPSQEECITSDVNANNG